MKRILCFCFIIYCFFFNAIAQDIKGRYTLLDGKTAPESNSLDKVVVVEYFSFACGHCYNFNSQLPEFKLKYKGRVIFKHYPLGYAGINPSKLYFIAQTKNKTTETKNLIFRAYHDSGIKNINNDNIILTLAQELNLKDDYLELKDESFIIDQIKFTKLFAAKNSIRSTPSFIIENSLLVVGANTKNLSLVIDSLLKK